MAPLNYRFDVNGLLNGINASQPLGVNATDLAHSGRGIEVAKRITSTDKAFGTDRIGKKLASSYNAETGTIDTSNLGRRSMRRLRKMQGGLNDIAENDDLMNSFTSSDSAVWDDYVKRRFGNQTAVPQNNTEVPSADDLTRRAGAKTPDEAIADFRALIAAQEAPGTAAAATPVVDKFGRTLSDGTPVNPVGTGHSGFSALGRLLNESLYQKMGFNTQTGNDDRAARLLKMKADHEEAVRQEAQAKELARAKRHADWAAAAKAAGITDVNAKQELLIKDGYLTTQTKADGLWGENSQEAYTRWLNDLKKTKSEKTVESKAPEGTRTVGVGNRQISVLDDAAPILESPAEPTVNDWDGFVYNNGDDSWFRPKRYKTKTINGTETTFYKDVTGNAFILNEDETRNYGSKPNFWYLHRLPVGTDGEYIHGGHTGTDHYAESRKQFETWYNKTHPEQKDENGAYSYLTNKTHKENREKAYLDWFKKTTGKTIYDTLKNGGIIKRFANGGIVAKYAGGGNLLLQLFIVDLAEITKTTPEQAMQQLQSLGKETTSKLFQGYAQSEQSGKGKGKQYLQQVLSQMQQAYKNGGCISCKKKAIDNILSVASIRNRFNSATSEEEILEFKCGGKTRFKKKLNGGQLPIEKCGGKTKKKSFGGNIEVSKCGGKTKKKEAGGTLNTAWLLNAATTNKGKKMIKADKCGGKTKKH